MSFEVATTTKFPQTAFQFVPQEIVDENVFEDLPILGGVLSDLKHVWHAKGPCLEIRTAGSGRKVGSWFFGGVVRDSNTKISAVGELKRGYGKLPLLVVALDCPLSGGLICVFDIFGSKVLRVVQIGEQITNLHVVDSACDVPVLPETSPLKYFDGIIAVGTVGGNVYLLDICKQICENALQNMDISLRDEVNPCQMKILKKEKISNIKTYVERSVEQEEHLAIHLNVVLKSSTDHFTLKGEEGDDRVHVNRTEAEVSALFYSSQIASLLVGYNFGAFQMWDLRALDLLYTSPICEGHIPVTHFTVQEPADDPKAYCYIWVSYSHNLLFHSGLPFAVMYSFYFDSKTFVNGYGNLYEEFQHCSIRFQLELGDTQSSTCKSRVKGGTCLGLQSINKSPLNKDQSSLALCLISWLIWDTDREINTAVLLFDLNQWYKEQMPRMPDWSHCSNYIIKNSLSEKLLDVKMDQRSLSQFMGIQRLEEHFCPTSLSFYLWGISEDSIFKIHNKGHQKTFLDKLMFDQHIALMKPDDYTEKIVNLGLVPLFCDNSLNNSEDIDSQRDLIFSVCLEQNLVGWLCKTSVKLSGNAFFASGLTLYRVLNWAFQRAITLKNACDKYCVPLFDYSGMRLDDNTITLISCSTNQIRNLCSVYQYVSSKLLNFVSDKEGFLEEQRSLENVVVYFEVLLWMVNIGLLPEYQSRGAVDNLLSAPYLVQELTQYYNKKRAQLQMASRETFVEKDCLLFIDNLINSSGGAEILRQQWQEDGGSGLYPPPSLQSLLRTYFLDSGDLVFKHSLVTYALLDIAMTVDEHNKVIKLLLKFPQIFNVTQSNTKIVQAFWHLDHDDYETACDSIMDPSVLLEDLQHWHHSVMMRSLLLQDQSGLALLYLQVRKPTIQDEKDLLTVISLLISKNMLDEAFKFRIQQKGPNDDDLLTHIFNECNKSELLHTLLYRRMNTDEEQAFFKYLQNTRNPRCEDLKVFYYLLRSRFLEAFDTYSLTKRRPDTQGLMGQRDASTADSVVKMFKGLLPDVSRNLVELVQKERTNLWKEVKKPLPLSVFVHNAKDQVHYKSSVIFAALAKAKQTFNDTLDDTNVGRDVFTEDTPFLMTPRVFRHEPRINTPLMKSKVIEQNEQGQEQYGPSPCKKLKLSPRTSKTSPIKSRNFSLSQSKLTTPIIKRKRQSLEQSNITAVLPQSILKSNSRTIVDDSIFDENTSVNTSLQVECENSIRRSRLGLTPRKSVRTPLKSHVKFDDLRYSGSSADQSSRNDSIPHNLTDSSKQSKNSTASTLEDVFYSPEHSFEASKERAAIEEPSLQTQSKETFDYSIAEDKHSSLTKAAAVVENTNKVPVAENDLSTNRLNFQSPKSRRSYKRSFGESPTPVRSSPRLAKKLSETIEEDETVKEPLSSNVAVQKLRGRRSLSRSVLENNAFSTLKSNVSWAPKDLGRESYSAASSLNSSIDVNSSFEAFLENQKYIGNTWESSFDTSNSLLMSDKEGEVVSKTTEVINVETRKESLIRKDTGVLVSSNETKEEYHSKTVEVFGDENMEQEQINKLSEIGTNQSTCKENAQTISSDDEDLNEPEKEDSSIETSTNKQQGLKEEEINVYDDLSSASEDIKEILQNRQDEPKLRDRSFSTSSYQTERKECEMPCNILDGEGSNSSNEVPKIELTYDEDFDMFDADEDLPETEKAFINSGEVIQIDSSSEEGSRGSDVSHSEESRNENFNSSTSSTYNSNESYKGSSEDNDLNICFANNLNERTVAEISDEDINILVEDTGKASRQIEIEDAVKSIEDQSECVEIEPYRVVESDEDMDSLILDDQDDRIVFEDTDAAVTESTSSKSETLPEERASEAPKMHSISLQCTLGDRLTTPDAENNSFAVEAVEKSRKSISLQCTLGDHLNAPSEENSFDVRETQKNVVDEENSIAVEEPLNTPDNSADKTIELRSVKKTYPGKISNKQQEEDNETEHKIEAVVEETVVVEERSQSTEMEQVEATTTNEEVQKSESSLQSLPSDELNTPDNSAVIESTEEIVQSDTSIKLRTVKKTYPGRKVVVDVNATPKLAVHLTKRTYSRKNSGTKIFNEDSGTSANENEDKTEAVAEETDKVMEIETKVDDITEDSQRTASTDEATEKTHHVDEPAKESIVTEHTMEQDKSETKAQSEVQDIQQESSSASSPAKEENETAVPKRVTRRSMLLSQEATPSSVSEESVASGGSKSSKKQPEAGTSRSRSLDRLSGNQSTSPKKTQQASKRRTRRVLSDVDSHLDVHSEPKPSDGDEEMKEQGSPDSKAGSSKVYAKRSSKTSKARSLSLSQPMKRTRSASVNLPSSNTRKRSVRSGSVDLSDMGIDHEGGKVFSLTPIIEVPTPKAASHIGDYTTSRRLTRRQANMLETIGRVEEEVKKLPDFKKIDPLLLLDKPDFEGTPDPDEPNLSEPSSPSRSSDTPSKHTRSASVASDLADVSTPTKKKSKPKTEQIIDSGIKTRLRRQSTDTMSVISEQSDSPSPPKRSRKKDDNAEPTSKSRTRAASVSSTKSAASEKSEKSGRSTRARRIQSAKSELEEIKEEKGNDEASGDATDTGKKRGRKKKE